MAKNYYTLEPDRFYPLRKHFTIGRGGAKIEFITRHHLMYIGEVEAVVDRIWSTRQASAHVIIGPTGRWGQAVGDNSTAWANANAWANARTIAIEHSNNTGRYPGGNDYHDRSWNISNETLREGARVAAAYCLYFGLGRPNYGTNIRDHNEFTATGCPVHLQGPRPGNAWGGRAGKYHQFWMDEATRFYDQLVNKAVNPDGTPIAGKFPAPTPEKEITVSEADRIIKFIQDYVGPIGSDTKDNRQQLTGGRDKGEYPGYPQIDDRTIVDALAVVGENLGIPGFFDPHGGSLREKNQKEN